MPLVVVKPVVGVSVDVWGALLNTFIDDTKTFVDVIEVAVGNRYTKPGSGIPKTDLAAAVSASLDKADAAIPATQKGAANGVATLNGSGVIPDTQIPSIAITEFLGAVANEAAMLATTGAKGDWVIRTDLGTVWTITGANPGILAGWTQLGYPTAPVTQVAGRTGAVVIGQSDVTGLTTALGLLAPKASPTFTGTVVVPDASFAVAKIITAELDERIRDVIGTALVAGANTTITVSDVGETITIVASAPAQSYATAIANTMYAVFKTAGSWPASRPSARADIVFFLIAPGTDVPGWMLATDVRLMQGA